MAGGAGDSVSETNQTIIKVGPGGQPSSSDDSEWDLQGVSKITGIYISFETDYFKRRINSLQFQYVDNNENLKLTPVYGNDSFAGTCFEMVEFRNPDEYIIGLKGAITNYPRYSLISLTFETNYRTYGPFGSVQDESGKFSFRFEHGNHFAGFYGTYTSEMLSSIGVYVRRNSVKTGLTGVVKQEVTCSNI